MPAPTLAELYTASDSDPTPIVGFLQALAATYELPQPLDALDVGCGPGRLLPPLERLRWRVTGMEPNPEFLASARAAAESSRRVSIRAGGFLQIDESEVYDLIVAINSSFAHLVTPRDREDALRRIFVALRSRGAVCLDLPNFVWILKNYREPQPYAFPVHGRTITLRRRHEIDVHAAKFTTIDEYVGEDGEKTAELVHTYGITTFPELGRLLTDLGYSDLRTFRGYGSRVDERLDGPRMLIAARKP